MKIVATVLLGPGTADVVGDAILTAAPYADEFAVIHSGDQTDLEAAVSAFQEANKPYNVLWHNWTGSYSEARNQALGCAALMGADWALTVDTDERLDLLGDPADVRKVLEKTEVAVVEAQCRDEGYWKERFIRIGTPGLQWVGRSCEELERGGKTARIQGAKFWELPKSPEKLRARQERGAGNMPYEIARDPDNPRWHRHYATCLKGLGRHEESLGPAQAAIDLFTEIGNREPECWTRYMMCESLCALEDYDAAAELAAVGLGRHAGMLPEFGSILAFCELKGGDGASRQNASRWAQLALITPPDKTRSFFRSEVCKQNAYRVLYAIHPDLAEQWQEKRFDSDDYARREAFRADYDVFVAAILEAVPLGARVNDFGAGQGFFLDALDRQGYTGQAYGCELEESARYRASEWAKDRILFGRDMLHWLPGYGTSVCLEVLEHMPEERAEDAVDSLCRASSGLVIFSAAQPGQGGHGHVNERPKWYWEEKFFRRGFSRAQDMELQVMRGCGAIRVAKWLPDNLMIFQRS